MAVLLEHGRPVGKHMAETIEAVSKDALNCFGAICRKRSDD